MKEDSQTEPPVGNPIVERGRLAWVEQVKALALIWIFLNHVSERLFSFPYFSNPSQSWPNFQERLAQLRPIDGGGLTAVAANILRYMGWSGDQGVQLFLIASGFGLTWSLLHRHGLNRIYPVDFFRRRLFRIFPLWVAAHLVFLIFSLFLTSTPAPSLSTFLLSVLGIRVTPQQLYSLVPAWWFIGLLIQLYLCFPLLWEILRRKGPAWLLGWSLVVAFLIRGAGLLYFDGYLDPWSRGAVFVTRLPEFVFGICFAAWLHSDPESARQMLRSGYSVVAAIGAYVVGAVLSLTLIGMTVAPFMVGAAAFVLLYNLLPERRSKANERSSLMAWTGQHSYGLYIVHHPVILFLLPAESVFGFKAIVLIILAAVVTAGSGIALEWTVGYSVESFKKWRERIGMRGTFLRIAGLAAALIALLVAGDLIVRETDPQEIMGWGERPSLQPDEKFGWKLIPLRETHLRWESYDYRVMSNALGFPAPSYPVEKDPQTIRILATGDAFTSAEGVDTYSAWPRLLEAKLQSEYPQKKVQVMNFAITGYGPKQYAAVIDSFAPVFKPNIIILELFVNDFEDVLTTDDQFRASIGFNLPPQESWAAYVRFPHLMQFLRQKTVSPLLARVRSKPSPPYGYFLANIAAFEKERQYLETSGYQKVAEYLGLIKQVAAGIGAQALLLLVPSSIQVCPPEELAYFPSSVDLRDSRKYDLERPQRMARTIADSLGLPYVDLRVPLRTLTTGCPYQRRNMHWTMQGHIAVAQYLSEILPNYEYVAFSSGVK